MSTRSDLLQARRPAVFFANNIGDAVLTLPTVRALGELFAEPLTLICPRVAHELCFRELSPGYVDISMLLPRGPVTPLLPSSPEYDRLAAEIGDVDVFVDVVPGNAPATIMTRPLRQRLTARTSIGFATDHDTYEITLPRRTGHSADLIFAVAELFDPHVTIEEHSGPIPIAPVVRDRARSIRAGLPPSSRVLAVHADTEWTAKQWPMTRFIDLLDRFLKRRPEFVVWVVGMGHEALNVGRERDRVHPHLGLPLDLAAAMVAEADLFLGIDSSMLHVADFARVPGVGMFGPTRSDTWGFRFAPHRHVDRRTMSDIAVWDVLAALDALIEDWTPSSEKLCDDV